jgi:hypothetical protein
MTSAPTQQLPADQAQAQREIEWWDARVQVAFVQYEVARRRLLQARDDLDIVQKIAAGCFEEDAPLTEEIGFYGVRPVHREHAIGSRGPWGWTA